MGSMSRTLAAASLVAAFAAQARGDIWSPRVNSTWQWQLQFDIDTSFDVDMYDVDLFDVSEETFREMQDRGIVVMCYFSAGTREDWRDDASLFPNSSLGNKLDWPGEVWLDVNDETVREIMTARLDLAAEKGCDGVEPDNVQVYEEGNSTGVNVTAEQQLDYNLFLAEEAHARNLSIGLKNDIRHLADLEPFFDWAINESCLEWDECEDYVNTFLKAGKAVFHAEYERQNLSFCHETNEMGLSTLLKAWDLGPARCSCQNHSTDMECEVLLETGTSSWTDGHTEPPVEDGSSATRIVFDWNKSSVMSLVLASALGVAFLCA